jgi:hypothetical protein
VCDGFSGRISSSALFIVRTGGLSHRIIWIVVDTLDICFLADEVGKGVDVRRAVRNSAVWAKASVCELGLEADSVYICGESGPGQPYIVTFIS